MKRLIFVPLAALALSGCISTGKVQPVDLKDIGAPVERAQTTAQTVFETGAVKHDPVVQSIIDDLSAAHAAIADDQKEVDAQAQKANANADALAKAQEKISHFAAMAAICVLVGGLCYGLCYVIVADGLAGVSLAGPVGMVAGFIAKLLPLPHFGAAVGVALLAGSVYLVEKLLGWLF